MFHDLRVIQGQDIKAFYLDLHIILIAVQYSSEPIAQLVPSGYCMEEGSCMEDFIPPFGRTTRLTSELAGSFLHYFRVVLS